MIFLIKFTDCFIKSFKKKKNSEKFLIKSDSAKSFIKDSIIEEKR